MDPACSTTAETALSRRSFFRLSAAASALASLPILTEAHLAAAAEIPKFADPNRGIHIDANENPLGPSPAALKAAAAILPRGGRYLFNLEQELVETIAAQEGLKHENILPWAGSSGPLHFAVLAFSGPDRPVVVADPGYEAPAWAAESSGAKVLKVPLADPKGAAAHDIRAMLTAATNPGVIYICNPNNPTGTLTPRAEIEYAVAHAPKGTIVLIDEAYLHFSEAQSAMDLVREGRDVIVLRTFSKLYGMAGLRLGYAAARPDLLQKLKPYGGMNALPVTASVAGTASLRDADLVPSRRNANAAIRQETINWLQAQGYACTPSASNCFLLDVKRPGREVMAALAAKDVFIGRIWPAWPTHVRITVGTAQEMATFRKAFAEVMASSTAGLEPAPLPERLAEHPFTHLS